MDPYGGGHWFDSNWVPDLSGDGDYHPNLAGINLEKEPHQSDKEEATPAHSASKSNKGKYRKERAYKEKVSATMPGEGRAARHTYTLQETDLIVKVWTNETNDAVRGTDQKGDAYWGRILARVNAMLNTDFGVRQLKGHFGRVSAEVKLWENTWVEVQSKWPSGYSDDMLAQKAQILFQQRSPHSGPFNYFNAWKVFRVNRRFKAMYLEGDVHSSKRTKTSEMGDFTTSASGEEITSSRPIENKAAKAAAKVAKAAKEKGKASQSSELPSEYKERFDRSDENMKWMIEEYHRNELIRQAHDDRILFMKTDGMDEETLALHKARVAKIVARMRDSGEL